ncbi:hypothetical protein FB451DRAFT_452408 [Mycena latifolia]|nr:hypothetical protein FB451DRAFT_452408 [Mycena latifolia]
MMYRIKVEGNLDNEPSPCDFFELIGGSGPGGIIALMLGRMRMSIADTIIAYEKLRPQSKMRFSEGFQASKLEEALRDIFKEDKMKSVGPNTCKTFVCAMNEMNLNAAIPELFRSYDTPEEPANDCMIWEAARATSAMPGLFESMEIDFRGIKQNYIDGGICYHNPTSLVLAEAKEIYPSRPVVLVVSIGSGHPDTIQILKSPTPGAVAAAMKGIATDCERTHEANSRSFHDIPNTYFRFNVQQGMQGFALQDWEKASEVSAHTKAYLRTESAKSKLTAAVKVILNPEITVSESPTYLKVCPPPSVRFTGRQDILREMMNYFNANIGPRHIFLLHGLGGSGKSQIAFKFVEQSARMPESRFSEVYFMDSSSQQTIENDLVTLVLDKKVGKTFQDGLHWLSLHRTEWLIVFDNADDIHLNLVKYFPSGSHGNILITSRNPDLGQHAQAEHKIARMALKEATQLLLSAARCDTTEAHNQDIGRQIVQRLHCLPLAVAQAGAYISSSRALQKYLELYESTASRIQLLNRRPLQSDYQWSVYTTWLISFQKISSQAAQMLKLCSFLHHDGISEGIFQQAASYRLRAEGPTEADLREPLNFSAKFLDSTGSKWDSLKFIAVTDELVRYSLIEFQAASGNIIFSIHPLVHEWCRSTTEMDAPTALCMHNLMGMAISSAKNDFRFIHTIYPHLDALLFSKTEGLHRQVNVLDTIFAREYFSIYYQEAKWDEGIELGNSMLHIASQKQAELETLHIQGGLAAMHLQKGEFRHAMQLQELVVERRRELGKDHPHTLAAIGNLAIIYKTMGELSKAVELEKVVLNKHRELLGEDHPATLIAMANLAVSYSRMEQFHQAVELEKVVLKKRTELLGEDHPKTLNTMGNLAIGYLYMGQFQQAAELENIVLKKRTELLGKNHPDTLKTMESLAFRYSQMGQFQQAAELENTVLKKRTELLGENHPDTLSSMGNLAIRYSEMGQFHQAADLEKVVLDKCREILGKDHPDTLKVMGNLGEIHYQQAEHFQVDDLANKYSRKGYLEQAEILQITSSDGLERILDPNNPKVLNVQMHLCATIRALGRWEEAETLGEYVVSRMTESTSLGSDHPTSLRAQAELAVTYRRVRRLEDSARLGMEVLKKQKELLGNEHPHSLSSMANLGLTYFDMGRFIEAHELQEQALNARQRILPEGHPDTMDNTRELAVTIQQLEGQGSE